MKVIITFFCFLILFQNMNSQNNKFKKSLKEVSVSKKKEFIEFYDTINKIYSNYKYNIGFKIPKKWSFDKGFTEHTILRTYDADSSNSFTINVIETKYDVEIDFWKTYDENKDEFENKYIKILESQLNTKLKNYSVEKSFIKNFHSLKRKFEFTRKEQNFEYEIVIIIQQVVKNQLTYTFSLSIPKMFYERNPNHYEKIFYNLHFLADKKKLNSLINSN